jgi:hypothetical protein
MRWYAVRLSLDRTSMDLSSTPTDTGLARKGSSRPRSRTIGMTTPQFSRDRIPVS